MPQTLNHQVSILIIDDEPQIRKFLDIALRAQGYQVHVAENGLKGLEILVTQRIGLLILDLGLPDMDGLEVLTELRQWSDIPVIVLSARPDENQKIKLLDAGANDYVTKPFSIQELSARVRVMFRTKPQQTEQAEIFDDGTLFVDVVEHVVKLAGQEIALSKKEFQLLALLISHQGKVVTQKQILTELWGSTHEEDTHYLRILVKKLRTKIGDSAVTPKYIATIAGIGLRFSTS
ncbi:MULTISPECIES: response regulator [Acinetobacter]|jgi:two-component system KDP operon response regulator KdpE|uniref:Response regulator transcription factor n=1 Tax=Acinetobacter johnsonii TaxID=40214 RepID=A0AAJ6LC66_ACIJO|nr:MULTISPECIES: response regulator transcription factor [Acinetobacter]ALV73890.1 transcriptional regulator [Acinetobacter johnsonii XBB1]MBO7705953.1 response regulator transcription factor [Acinetobacter sp.]MCV2452959.1 response regulator transcription factor [Acinetobacter johnsonii]MDH1241153.1 response regulator transcription factor [Acinetobacter johnsonii]MDH1531710.1 response regulator transcription factor [Acinetobacter johnsonii]